MNYIEIKTREYYENNAAKLHNMVNKILKNFGGIYQKDLDDFYSLANIVFVSVCSQYDNDKNFDSFLYACLFNRIKSEITRRNRNKRQADRMSVSIYLTVGEDGNLTIEDTLISDFNIEDTLPEEFGFRNDDKIQQYLNKLSKIQRQIVLMLSEDFKSWEIKQRLHISEREYMQHLEAARSYENISILL